MISVLRTTWPLLLGIMLLLVGNGMQGTLLGIRGGYEQISTDHMAVVMSGYFAGFLLGSRMVPGMIQRVGHVRVFAALGSLISAVLILYAAVPNWIVWSLLRVLIGFSFSGVYITAESWLNASTTNENRGQAMSAYMIVQMIGLVSAQFLINFGDPGGFMLFIVPSVLVSLAFTPILLSAQPAPAFGALKRMSFKRLYQVSPLGCIGIFVMGGVFSAMLGMTSVWGTVKGMSVRDISAIVAAVYLGGLVAQFPIGWLSDRMDRRLLILQLLVLGVLAIALQLLLDPGIWGTLIVAGIAGGVANPVYALLLAHTNDYLDADDMAAASAGLLFLNGLGAVGGPLIVGRMMSVIGPNGFWIYILLLMAALAAYTAWRMTQRVALTPEETGSFAVIAPAATTVAVEVALENAQDDPPPVEDQEDIAPADYEVAPAEAGEEHPS
ncbi:MAG TPA: MFS transporter [Paracoccus sp. (in: a-proteobacteria)]|uniref:MFS transporter n=1 Tax=uncultured Paracoccus sp. TaxID=189685 RepID=UPI002614BD33|nr:MFS transporter [uncultured Paracoccus sp.]HMQ39628.1 MFS transporter [Paracoccus sp. (in: a-proteobacteria)]HMR36791.1 MFS transporter [Paracoccus sp. (in: a-proteobacteria)]